MRNHTKVNNLVISFITRLNIIRSDATVLLS